MRSNSACNACFAVVGWSSKLRNVIICDIGHYYDMNSSASLLPIFHKHFKTIPFQLGFVVLGWEHLSLEAVLYKFAVSSVTITLIVHLLYSASWSWKDGDFDRLLDNEALQVYGS